MVTDMVISIMPDICWNQLDITNRLQIISNYWQDMNIVVVKLHDESNLQLKSIAQ